MPSSLFFFQCSVHHRDLHSFPTRRSSDLVSRRRGTPRRASSTSKPARHSGASDVARSEEHTSELQSPDHLVCRLLLEKKKTKNYSSVVGTIAPSPRRESDVKHALSAQPVG